MHRQWTFEWPPRKPPVYRQSHVEDAAVVERLSAQLADDIKAYRRWRWRTGFGRLLRFAVIIALILTVFSRLWSNAWWLFLVFGGSKLTDTRADRRRRTAGMLAQTRDPRAVNVLAIAHRSGDPATRTVASEGLQALLPSLKASDASLITPDGMKALLALLSPRKLTNLKLVHAALDALKQVGDARAIPAVQKLVTMPYAVNLLVRITDRWHYAPLGARIRQIQREADECLAILRSREKQEKDRNMLLRPAERPPDEENLLLRPAMGARPQDDLSLVRPAEVEDAPSLSDDREAVPRTAAVSAAGAEADP